MTEKAATLTGPLLQAGGADLGRLEPRGTAGCCPSPGTVRTWEGEGEGHTVVEPWDCPDMGR